MDVEVVEALVAAARIKPPRRTYRIDQPSGDNLGL
jgi:hypothetical protein